MDEPGDAAGLVELARPLFEAADPQHARVDLEQLDRAGGWRHRGFSVPVENLTTWRCAPTLSGSERAPKGIEQPERPARSGPLEHREGRILLPDGQEPLGPETKRPAEDHAVRAAVRDDGDG